MKQLPFLFFLILFCCLPSISASQPVLASEQPTTITAGQPYGGTPWVIPGTIQIEDFDLGGETIAYEDSDSQNIPGHYRQHEAVDIERMNNKYYVTNTKPEEWLDYTINVEQTGYYLIRIYVASQGVGGTFSMELDGVPLFGNTFVPNTGNQENFIGLPKRDIYLPTGIHTLRLSMGTANTQIGNFDYLTVTYQEPLTISFEGSGQGLVSSTSPLMMCDSSCTRAFDPQTQLALTATPNSGSLFEGWQGACSGTTQCIITLDQAQTVFARFTDPNANPRYSTFIPVISR